MLKLDYDELESSSRILKDQGDTFEDCITEMSRVVNGLPDIWEADTCNQYVEQYNTAKKTLDEVRTLIQEMAEQMDSIAKNFRDADVNMAGQM